MNALTSSAVAARIRHGRIRPLAWLSGAAASHGVPPRCAQGTALATGEVLASDEVPTHLARREHPVSSSYTTRLRPLVMARTSVAFILPLLVFIGCSALGTQPEPPNVSVSHLELVDTGLFEQRYRLYLRVQNPNDVALWITGMRFALELNGRPFATGVNAHPTNVPPYGEVVKQIDVVSGLAQVLEQLQLAGEGRLERARYVFSGVLHLGNGGLQLPFVRAGELVLLPLGERHAI